MKMPVFSGHKFSDRIFLTYAIDLKDKRKRAIMGSDRAEAKDELWTWNIKI